MNRWQKTTFTITTAAGPEQRKGHVYSGLGLDRRVDDCWIVTHLGTGLKIAVIQGDEPRAFAVADALADAGDWLAFDKLNGWKNTDPELQRRVREILAFNGCLELTMACYVPGPGLVAVQ